MRDVMNEWSSVHFSPKYRAALLLGACHMKGIGSLAGRLSPSGRDDLGSFGGTRAVFSSKLFDGSSRLRPMRLRVSGDSDA